MTPHARRVPFFPPGLLAILAALTVGPGLATAADEAEVVESKATYESQGKTIRVECYEPRGGGKHPAVLVLHGSGGMIVGGAFFRESARRLARRGFVAHVVHYFDRTGTVIADRSTMQANFPAWMRAVADGITNVSKQPNVDPTRVGLFGYSLGSYLSLSVSVYDHRVSAVVDYFGGLPPVIARDVRTLPPVLILHGDADPIVPVDEAKALRSLCESKSFVHEVRIYPGQGHGFRGPDGDDALRRALAFLDAHVKSAPPAARRPTAPVPAGRG